MPDDLLDAIHEQWSNIRMMYESFEELKPIILYDIEEGRVYAYDYIEFGNDLSERNRRSLKRQYEKAARDSQMVVYVRDNVKRRLVSYSLDL